MPEQHLEKRGQSMAYKLNVTEYVFAISESLVKQNMEAYEELAK